MGGIIVKKTVEQKVATAQTVRIRVTFASCHVIIAGFVLAHKLKVTAHYAGRDHSSLYSHLGYVVHGRFHYRYLGLYHRLWQQADIG
jgi:hypothetical protein